jgi:dihydroorotate dehydrogenase (fumarate)
LEIEYIKNEKNMAQLKTTFAGLTLNNPIIISSSGLTNSLAKIQKLEEAGAGAVVLKSVFEEQINMQAGSMQGYGSPEAACLSISASSL